MKPKNFPWKNKVAVFTFKADIKPGGYKVYELGMPSGRTRELIYRLFFFMDVFKIAKTIRLLQDYDKIVCFIYPMTILGANCKKTFRKRICLLQ